MSIPPYTTEPPKEPGAYLYLSTSVPRQMYPVEVVRWNGEPTTAGGPAPSLNLIDRRMQDEVSRHIRSQGHRPVIWPPATAHESHRV